MSAKPTTSRHTGTRRASGKPHEAYRNVALVLQGGGALGSYQAGVFEGLSEGGIEPNWVAGISIGALNAAVVAGNAPSRRVTQLRAFWEHICQQPWWPAPGTLGAWGVNADGLPPVIRRSLALVGAGRALLEGQNGFFVPRSLPPLVPGSGTPATASWYDTSALRETLERFVDFDRLNRPQEMRVSVGATEVGNGNFHYFDNTEQRLGPEHFMASAALPPGFPAVKVGNAWYWDGGLVSNTPLLQVLSAEPRRDTLVFQVDLWGADGELPTSMVEVAERQKDIQYSSRTRMITTYMHDQQVYRKRLSEVLALVPPAKRSDPAYRHAAALACDRRCNVIQMIYRNKPYEGEAKDYEFSSLTMRDHWNSGLDDVRATLAHPQWLEMPTAEHPFVTHDVHRQTDAAKSSSARPAS